MYEYCKPSDGIEVFIDCEQVQAGHEFEGASEAFVSSAITCVEGANQRLAKKPCPVTILCLPEYLEEHDSSTSFG